MARRDQLWRSLGINQQARTSMCDAGIFTLLDLKNYTAEELFKLPGIKSNVLIILKPYLKR